LAVVVVVVVNGTVLSKSGASSVTKKAGLHNATRPRPALGWIWKNAADIHVSLEPVLSPQPNGKIFVVQAKLERHPAKRCSEVDPMFCSFAISSTGIQDISSNLQV
jgi:hypothetical protein